MADKRIQDLTPAESIQLADRFVLEQAGQAKSLTGQILLDDLATALDGHGGISDITYTAPVAPSLDGTLTITMADGTTYDVTVTNGNGIASIAVAYGVSNTADPAYVQEWNSSVVSPTDALPYAFTRFTITDSTGGTTVAYTITRKADDPTIIVGEVTAEEGETADATVTNVGTAYNPVLKFDFTLPQGEKGDTGYYIEPVTAYAVSTDGTTAPSSWQSSPPNISSGEYLWEKIEYILVDPDNPQTLRTVTSVIGYVGINGGGSGTLTGVTFNGTAGTVDVGTGICSITATASDVGAIATPANAPLNNQVLTFDSTLNAWTPKTPSTGSVNSVNNVYATAGTTNIQLYATAIPISSSDNTPVASAIPSEPSTTPLSDSASGAIGTVGTYATATHRHPANVIAVSAAFAIPASGSSVSYDMAGMTNSHQLIRWNFSASAENSPPADLTWRTHTGYFTIENTSGTTAETIQPVFAIPVSISTTSH